MCFATGLHRRLSWPATFWWQRRPSTRHPGSSPRTPGGGRRQVIIGCRAVAIRIARRSTLRRSPSDTSKAIPGAQWSLRPTPNACGRSINTAGRHPCRQSLPDFSGAAPCAQQRRLLKGGFPQPLRLSASTHHLGGRPGCDPHRRAREPATCKPSAGWRRQCQHFPRECNMIPPCPPPRQSSMRCTSSKSTENSSSLGLRQLLRFSFYPSWSTANSMATSTPILSSTICDVTPRSRGRLGIGAWPNVTVVDGGAAVAVFWYINSRVGSVQCALPPAYIVVFLGPLQYTSILSRFAMKRAKWTSALFFYAKTTQ